jgi:hypothetical protein
MRLVEYQMGQHSVAQEICTEFRADRFNDDPEAVPAEFMILGTLSRMWKKHT